jgi:hypothetical protein
VLVSVVERAAVLLRESLPVAPPLAEVALVLLLELALASLLELLVPFIPPTLALLVALVTPVLARSPEPLELSALVLVKLVGLSLPVVEAETPSLVLPGGSSPEQAEPRLDAAISQTAARRVVSVGNMRRKPDPGQPRRASTEAVLTAHTASAHRTPTSCCNRAA